MATYRGYTADLKIDEESKLIVGKVLDINDTITFDGSTVEEAIQEFHKRVDAYLKFCKKLGRKPDKPFSGKLAFRTTPDIHRSIYLAAAKAGKSINAWMEATLGAASRDLLDQEVNSLVEKDDRTKLITLVGENPHILPQIHSHIAALEQLLYGLRGVLPFMRGELPEESLMKVVEIIIADYTEKRSRGTQENSPRQDHSIEKIDIAKLLKKTSGLVHELTSVGIENWISALEELLTGLDAVRSLIEAEPFEKGIVKLVRIITNDFFR